MPRKLVTVRRVTAKHPIPGADRIEAAVVDGWTCVTKLDEFQVGDLAVYFEIDSFLPADDPRWEFLAKSFTRLPVGEGSKEFTTGFRVRSVKLRGQISQGLLQPLSGFPEVAAALPELEAEHGKDGAVERIREMSFEDVLKVRKWERPEPDFHRPGGDVMQTTMGPFPRFIPRTDQERVQNLPNVFERWGDKVFQETTKMDGSSMSVYFLRRDHHEYPDLTPFHPTGGRTGDLADGRFGVCSRNVELVEREANHFWTVALRHGLPEKLAGRNRNIALQGELCGSSIQGNFEGFPVGVHDFYLFAVWDIDVQKYLSPKEAEEWARDLGIPHVPVHGYLKLRDIAGSVGDMLRRAEGKGIHGKKREGIVLKHEDGVFSFKAISNSYLLKHGE